MARHHKTIGTIKTFKDSKMMYGISAKDKWMRTLQESRRDTSKKRKRKPPSMKSKEWLCYIKVVNIIYPPQMFTNETTYIETDPNIIWTSK